jgi:hypothetical protein
MMILLIRKPDPKILFEAALLMYQHRAKTSGFIGLSGTNPDTQHEKEPFNLVLLRTGLKESPD